MLFNLLQICRFYQEQALTSDFNLLFIHLKGQIVKTHLKFP